MNSTSQIKEEFYLRRVVGDDFPAFADLTGYVRDGNPYPLTKGTALRSTCGVWLDDEVAAFSLRDFTATQARREVETIEDTLCGRVMTRRNVLWPRMPRRTMHELRERARELSTVLGPGDVIIELHGETYVLALTRTHDEAELRASRRLREIANGHVVEDIDEADAEFELPPSGVRLRAFMRSPIRGRVIAYAYRGYLCREPGESERVTRATALALDSALGLATFRMLSAFDGVKVPPAPGPPPIRSRHSVEPLLFTVPVLLFTDDGSPAARGRVAGEIDLERLDPVTGGPALRLSADHRLEWDPAIAGSVRFESYRPVLTENLIELIGTSLGTEAMRDLTHDIMLGDLGNATTAALCAAVTDLPRLSAAPGPHGGRPAGSQVDSLSNHGLP